MVCLTAALLALAAPCLGQAKGDTPAAKTEETAAAVVTETAKAAEPTASSPLGLFERPTLTDNWFGLGESLADKGIEVQLGLTNIYQINSRGGMSTHRHAGRWTGSYDLELTVDFEKLLGWKGLSAYVLTEGSWSDGLSASAIGDFFGVNGDAAGDRSIDVTQLWFQQSLLEDKVQIRLGKLDLTGGFECHGCPVTFDGNSFANDETGQFLNSALINNPTIPFPEAGLGLVVYVQPTEHWYAGAGIADAQADARETGFATAFGKEDDFFSIFETGVTPEIASARGPLQGAYRVGFWYDPQRKARLDGMGNRRDDLGLYVSADQVVLRENAESDQGLGLFCRLGWVDSELHDIKSFWSVGGQYKGLLKGRDEDVLGVGFAQGRTTHSALLYTDRHETVMEVYYNVQVAPWLSVSPSIQYIWNPGCAGAGEALVSGVRLQMLF
jgi:porin